MGAKPPGLSPCPVSVGKDKSRNPPFLVSVGEDKNPCVCWGKQKPEKPLAEDGAAPCCQASTLVL